MGMTSKKRRTIRPIQPQSQQGARRRGALRGFSLLEVMLTMTFFTVGTGAVMHALIVSMSLSRTLHERSAALDAAYSVIETMQGETFDEVFARYNQVEGDDLPGSPGSSFDVRGLTPQAGDADGRVGAVIFPGDGIVLREDFEDRELGMPRDLNGDSVVDEDGHLTYRVLPVRVRVDWRGAVGAQSVELVTTLTND